MGSSGDTVKSLPIEENSSTRFGSALPRRLDEEPRRVRTTPSSLAGTVRHDGRCTEETRVRERGVQKSACTLIVQHLQMSSPGDSLASPLQNVSQFHSFVSQKPRLRQVFLTVNLIDIVHDEPAAASRSFQRSSWRLQRGQPWPLTTHRTSPHAVHQTSSASNRAGSETLPSPPEGLPVNTS